MSPHDIRDNGQSRRGGGAGWYPGQWTKPLRRWCRMISGTMDKAAEAVMPDDIRRNEQSRRDGRRVGGQE